MIAEKTQEELEGALMLIVTDVREYRDREQKHLSDPTIKTGELMQTVGAVIALKNVEAKLNMLAELYGLRV